MLAKARAPEQTEHYTLPEAKAIIEALETRVDAQSVFACAFFLGLRPSEIAGLRWEDVRGDRIHVQRAAVLGVVDGTKTRKSTEQLLLIEPVRSLLEEWRVKSGSPKDGWVFPNQKRGPLNVASFTRHVMQPMIEAAGCTWRALYAGRRGAGTILRDLTGNLLAAQQVLRHEQLATTDRHYALPSIEVGDAGLKMLEAAWMKK
ncbi:MAG: tyrosine-type recombinase/integrase [Terriglobales bacterium]